MRRLVPYPLLAVSLLLVWLLLTQSFSAGQLSLGAIVALGATWAMTALRPATSPVRAVAPLVRLVVIVAADIVRSNLAVARIVLDPRERSVAKFVTVPLETGNIHALTLLALIVTATPGTMWVQHDRDRRSLLIHVFDLVDEAAWIQLFKNRYEALLIEAFGR